MAERTVLGRITAKLGNVFTPCVNGEGFLVVVGETGEQFVITTNCSEDPMEYGVGDLLEVTIRNENLVWRVHRTEIAAPTDGESLPVATPEHMG
jgi:hypothetical protein